MNTSVQEKVASERLESADNGELTIKVASTQVQTSPMSDELKSKVRVSAPSLYKIFEETLQRKGEYNLEEISWNDQDEVEVGFISQAAIHSFALEAEKLGKTITYERVLKIKVTD